MVSRSGMALASWPHRAEPGRCEGLALGAQCVRLARRRAAAAAAAISLERRWERVGFQMRSPRPLSPSRHGGYWPGGGWGRASGVLCMFAWLWGCLALAPSPPSPPQRFPGGIPGGRWKGGVLKAILLSPTGHIKLETCIGKVSQRLPGRNLSGLENNFWFPKVRCSYLKEVYLFWNLYEKWK